MLASWKNIRGGTTPITAVPVSWLLNQDQLPYDWLLTMVWSTRKPKNHSGSIPNMVNTLECIAKCRYKTKMDKRSGFWQVDLTAATQELLALITPKGRVFIWKVIPFGVTNAPALFQELMNKILYILRRRPLVQELISRDAEMEAHLDEVSLGTNTMSFLSINLSLFVRKTISESISKNVSS